MIPYGRQDISETDVNEVIAVLKSDYLTQGPAVPAFEKSVADYCGANYAFAVANATAALHIACLALGLGKGDILWTSPVTFVASSNCGLYCGADVDFVDIDSKTYNLSPAKLREKLVAAKESGRLPKVVVAVHLCGQSCEMKELKALADEYGFSLIEDASHTIGGEYLGKPVGGCEYSDITVFSFHPVKIITTGEGGMALTNCKKLATSMELLRSHGITRDPELMVGESDGGWYYQQLHLGFNYRMTDIQAALGCSQMTRLDEFMAARRAIAKRYDAALADVAVVTPWQHADTTSAYHLYVIRLELDQISKTHKEVFDELRASGIGVNLHYMPVYRQPYYREHGFADTHLAESEKYYSEAISLPMYSTLSEKDQQEVIQTLSRILGK